MFEALLSCDSVKCFVVVSPKLMFWHFNWFLNGPSQPQGRIPSTPEHKSSPSSPVMDSTAVDVQNNYI